MDVTVKTVSIHIVAAIVAALISTAFTTGMLGFTNHVFAFVVGLVILYLVKKLKDFQLGYGMESFHLDSVGSFYGLF
nr:hypothetical protein [uncultured Methanobrevibacter sp.]